MRRRCHSSAALAATALMFVGTLSGHAVDAANQITRGHEMFENWCASCHAPVSGGERLAGTSALELRYKGSKPAALEQRNDLTPQLVAYYVRHGINAMPWFRKTEISDDDVAALGAYLARNHSKK